MARITRIATTVTARYFPGQGATDAFYLDGRLTGRRESRAADITLDREDRGAFFAVFAHQAAAGKEPQAEMLALRPDLDRILNDVKKTNRNIDAEINELADCGVTVAGRMTLQHAGVRQPYFAGVVVKDQEIAAITIGRGCAYLYRNDVLYPLTDDEFEMEEIDAFGRPVDRLDIYCAGVAGTVRYSNIAQLQMDDCLIVCNREVMEALGQREVLRILYEAEDQSDAAGMVITEAAAKSPGASLQFMIGFVESATVADKPGRGIWSGKKSAAPLPPPALAAAPALADLPVQPEDLSDIPALFDPERASEPTREEAAADTAAAPSADGADEEDAPVLDIPDIQPSPATYVSDRTTASPAHTRAAYGARGRDDDVFPAGDYPEDDGDEDGDYGHNRWGTYLLIAIVAVALVAALYLIFRKPGTSGDPTQPEQPTPVVTTTQLAISPTIGATQPGGTAPSGESTQPLGTTTAGGPATIDPATPRELPARYTVQPGDTLYRIAAYFYGDGGAFYVDLIRAANQIDANEALYVDAILDIPEVPAQTAPTTPPAAEGTTTTPTT